MSVQLSININSPGNESFQFYTFTEQVIRELRSRGLRGVDVNDQHSDSHHGATNRSADTPAVVGQRLEYFVRVCVK